MKNTNLLKKIIKSENLQRPFIELNLTKVKGKKNDTSIQVICLT